MPRRDGTGPEGRGAGTGRKTGNCFNSGENINDYTYSRGLGRSMFNRRRGKGNGFAGNGQENGFGRRKR